MADKERSKNILTILFRVGSLILSLLFLALSGLLIFIFFSEPNKFDYGILIAFSGLLLGIIFLIAAIRGKLPFWIW